jgi:hypothetical protein
VTAVEIDLGRAVPGRVVRGLPALAAVAAEAVAAPHGMAGWARAGWLAGSAALLLRAPGTGAAGGVLLTTGLALLARPAEEWRTALLVLLLHAVVVLAPLAAYVPWRSSVELAVLTRTALGAALAQAVAQLLALAALPAAAGGAHPWLRVLALAATVVLAVVSRAPARSGAGAGRADGR